MTGLLTILVNSAKCKICASVIYSKNRHDFTSCTCGKIAVDGGMAYSRLVGNREDMVNRSIFIQRDLQKECWLALDGVMAIAQTKSHTLDMPEKCIQIMNRAGLVGIDPLTEDDCGVMISAYDWTIQNSRNVIGFSCAIVRFVQNKREGRPLED